jgi:hypothetical protein
MALAERVLRVERGFERSRLETECMASAYELLLPIQRRKLISPRREGVLSTPQWQDKEPLRSAAGA